MATLKDVIDFVGRIDIHLWLSGPDAYYARHKDIVKLTRTVAKAIKKERGLKSYHQVPDLNRRIKLGKEAEERFAEFKLWWEKNQPPEDSLEIVGQVNDRYLFSKVQQESWKLPYASHTEFKAAVDSLIQGLTETRQECLWKILDVTFALGRTCAA